MIRFVIVEVLYITYLVGVVLLFLLALSASMFGGTANRERRTLLRSLGFAVLWPLALFSAEGRAELKRKLLYRT